MRKLLLLVAAFFAFSTVAQASSLVISPASFNELAGTSVLFDLDVDLTDPASGGRFLIVYDPAVFDFESFVFTPGNPWNDGDQPTQEIAEFIASTPGEIDVRVVAEFFGTISGSFDIGDFTLFANSPAASTMVGLDDSGIPASSRWGSAAGPISIDFFGSVGSIVIPIPAVAYMFPAGLLAGLGWMRRRGRLAK